MAGISAVQNLAPSVRVTQESKVDMQQIVSTGAQKATRVAGQSQDNVVNLDTSQAGKAETNDQYSHQRYIAYNAYINLGRDPEAPTATERFEQIQNAGKEVQLSPESNAPTQAGTSTDKGTEGSAITGTTQEQGQDEEQEQKLDPNTARAPNGEALSEEEQAEVEDMKARDDEVRIHEQAHQSAGGQYAGAPQYEYANGPDGKRYITDGSVSIDVSEESDPQATINKMQIVKRAALAPAEPSAQDRRVYAEAAQKEAEARQELNEQKQEEAQAAQGGAESSTSSAAPSANAGAAETGQSNSTSTGTSRTAPDGNASSRNTTNGAKQNTAGVISSRAAPEPATLTPNNESTTSSASASTTGTNAEQSLVPDSSSIPEGTTAGTARLSQGTLDSNREDDDVPQLV